MCGIFFYMGETIDGKMKKILEKSFNKIRHRGPDVSKIKYYNSNVAIGFHRLSITDIKNGMQPFEDGRYVCVVNGEIYNHKSFSSLTLKTHSDCEVVLPLFLQNGKNINKTIAMLDGEYAFIIYDTLEAKVWFGVDQLRIRPLFIGIDEVENEVIGIYLASEQKSLTKCDIVFPLPSGCYGTIDNINKLDLVRYFSLSSISINENIEMETASNQIRELLIDNVSKKLNPDREYGFLLSGGLDSSLVCGIAARLMSPMRIHTFTVGFDVNASDVIAARKVAEFIDSIHTEYIFSFEDGIKILREVIYTTESWDQTTIRASSIMLLLVRAIKKDHPEMGVIFSAELADELFMGYLEWQNSPNLDEARKHSIKRLSDVTYFDGLRSDRIVSSVGMELRLPFFSKSILQYVLSLPTQLISPVTNDKIEKYLLRYAFANQNYIPDEILWRTKNAFSDATSIIGKNSWKEYLKRYAENEITDSRFNSRKILYPDNTPQTKEDFLYREIFSDFNYTGSCIPYKWLSNWSGDITDSSATALPIFSENI